MNAFYLKKCVFRVEAKKQAVGDLQAQNHELKTCAKRILLKLPTLNVDANLKEEIVQKFNVRNVDVIAVAICEKKNDRRVSEKDLFLLLFCIIFFFLAVTVFPLPNCNWIFATPLRCVTARHSGNVFNRMGVVCDLEDVPLTFGWYFVCDFSKIIVSS